MTFYKKLKTILVFAFFMAVSAITNAAVLTTYYHNDQLGSPIAATDEYGFKLWTENYQAYGERTVNNTNAQENRFWFTGKPQDSNTGLSYFGARYYDPLIGRFMAVDPVGARAGDIHNFNRYAYANNNPYMFVDPDGKDALPGFARDMAKMQGRDMVQYDAANKRMGEVVLAGVVVAGVTYFSLGVLGPAATELLFLPTGVGVIGGLRGGAVKSVTKGTKGLEIRGVKSAPGTRVRPEGVPDGWRIRPTRSKGGTEYYNPKNPNESVRVMQGNPNSPYPNSQKPYVRQRDSSGSFLDATGNRGANKSSDTHIPLDQFRFKK